MKEKFGTYNLLVDLTKSERPPIRHRKLLHQKLVESADYLNRMAIFTGDNLILNTAARFAMHGFGENRYIVSKCLEDCISFVSDESKEQQQQ